VQLTYTHWERHPVALRRDQLEALAGAIGITLAELVRSTETKPRTERRGGGSVACARHSDEHHCGDYFVGWRRALVALAYSTPNTNS
jgi:hypothetical protein